MNTPSSKGKKKTIVDPSVWESCEVGGKEATVQKTKVSSMRSSLFKKKKAQKHDAIYGIKGERDHDPIFSLPVEVEALQVPFQHDTISLDYCDYGKANKKLWPKDIFAVVHNALRSELKDLSVLLRALKKVGPQLRVGDFSVIRPWWQVCSGVILDYIDAEEKYLIPWIEKAIEGQEASLKPSGQFFSEMGKKRAEIRGVVHDATNMLKDFCDAPDPTKGLAKMSNAQRAIMLMGCFDALVFRLGLYMTKEEEIFPEVLEGHYTSEKKERDQIIGKMVKFYVKKGRRCDSMLVLLTRWMTDVKTQKSFKKALLDVHDCNYKFLQTNFEVTHAGFVQQFRVRAGLQES
ncbi:hypothetical protein BWQ96_05562 [Gracilariopsis chorda]|uniref:Uncharacterized protein n=1 Tax=Gracilariopsis chorda TaxID=448386 RepID=A0A2V3IRF0_9FLOR|nr:hypothetical protein BWQ96_05562 [Gracilariopsis chorda]|eukprot:PXF44705.1 hypothetical protein BWQ96_05562 [Gracilariopsis chorda]